MTQEQQRRQIITELEEQGFSTREARMFLAGATLLGYMSDHRASWARDYLIKKYITGRLPDDTFISRAGETDFKLDEWTNRDQVALAMARKSCHRCEGKGIIWTGTASNRGEPCPLCSRQCLR
jgi:hypothetical protein